jgi:hypothetical protein
MFARYHAKGRQLPVFHARHLKVTVNHGSPHEGNSVRHRLFRPTRHGCCAGCGCQTFQPRNSTLHTISPLATCMSKRSKLYEKQNHFTDSTSQYARRYPLIVPPFLTGAIHNAGAHGGDTPFNVLRMRSAPPERYHSTFPETLGMGHIYAWALWHSDLFSSCPDIVSFSGSNSSGLPKSSSSCCMYPKSEKVSVGYKPTVHACSVFYLSAHNQAIVQHASVCILIA